MPTPSWTIDEVKKLRRSDGERLARQYDCIGKYLAPFIGMGMRSAAKFFGDQVYQPSLERIAHRMNRNRLGAFQNYHATSSDVVCSAYFKAGTNWIMHVCYQIAHLGHGEFDHIQDVIAWPDAAEPRYWRALDDSNAEASPTKLRVIKSHLSADLVPLTSETKFIAVTRDPLDCAASGYHFFAKLVFGPKTPPPDVWLDFFATQNTISGTWDQFTAS